MKWMGRGKGIGCVEVGQGGFPWRVVVERIEALRRMMILELQCLSGTWAEAEADGWRSLQEAISYYTTTNKIFNAGSTQ